MERRSKHLSSEESGVILAEALRGTSQRATCALLDRSASPICREWARGRQDDGWYSPQSARLVYDVRRTRCLPDTTFARHDVGSFTRQMKRLPAALCKSMTYDRVSDMVCRFTLEVRQFMPKGTDLSDASQTKLNDVAALMHSRPGKTLGWKTAVEAMAEEMAAFNEAVALAI